MEKNYIRKKQACEMFGISLQTLRRWVLQGLVRTELDGFLVCESDIKKAKTRKKIKQGRPYCGTTNK